MRIGNGTFLLGDCLEVMRTLGDASVDAIVTDPPYGLEFMGKDWDASGIANDPAVWRECLRLLKPGGHLLSFGGSRTYHRMACAVEDAGFDIRDQIMWIYGSGFPKSMNVQQAINKAERGYPQGGRDPTSPNSGKFKGGRSDDNPTGRGFGAGAAAFMVEMSTGRGDDDGPWHGWGTALKPAHEPIVLARKPLVGTVAANVLAHGTGALNIDGCRVHGEDAQARAYTVRRLAPGASVNATGQWKQKAIYNGETKRGRWPANIIHDGSDEVVVGFPSQAGAAAPVRRRNADKFRNAYGSFAGNVDEAGSTFHGDSGSAARFFYCAKASKSDRGAGNTHPTVKPSALIEYLIRLVAPEGALVLDPFGGSGTTAVAAERTGRRWVCIEKDPDYYRMATMRAMLEVLDPQGVAA